MASTRDEIGSFGTILGRRLEAFRTSEQSAGAEGQPPAKPDPVREAIGETRIPEEAEEGARSPVPEAAATIGDGRPFERLRAIAQATAERHATRPAGGVDVDPAASVLPLDDSKTFVGVNATHYDECWRLMEWRRTNRSWNWAAALTFGGWLAYRRLYGYALLNFVWLGLLLFFAAKGISVVLLASLQVAVVVILGLYGNALYRRRFRKAAMAAARREGDHAARLASLAAAGGVDPRAVWTMGLATAIGTALIVSFSESVGSGVLP
jgi:Protein of unknown function (DUF2628)